MLDMGKLRETEGHLGTISLIAHMQPFRIFICFSRILGLPAQLLIVVMNIPTARKSHPFYFKAVVKVTSVKKNIKKKTITLS